MKSNEKKENLLTILERVQMYQRQCIGAPYFVVRLTVNEDHTAYLLTVTYSDGSGKTTSWTISTDNSATQNDRIMADMTRTLQEAGHEIK